MYDRGAIANLEELIGERGSTAYSINDSGQIVGVLQPSGLGNDNAFLYDKNTGLTKFGRLQNTDIFSWALDINNNSQIVGFSGTNYNFSTPDGNGIRAFVINEGKMQDLNNLIPTQSGYIITQARAINDLGQIVGTASFNGQLRAVVLTPEPNTKSVKEPATIFSLLALLAVLKRLKK